MARDFKGGSRSGMYGLGASNRSETERDADDFYATPPSAVSRLLDKLKELGVKLPHTILEPAVGKGHIAKVLVEKGYDVEAQDIDDRGYPNTKLQSFLETENIDANAIITNPPYKYGLEFVEKSIDLLKRDEYCIMLLKLQFLEGVKRANSLYKNGLNPKYIICFPDRINCAKQGDFDKESETGGQVAYCWYVWQKGYSGPSEFHWM